MRTTHVIVACAAALFAASCTSIRPVTVADGDQCFRCRRTITNVRVAAETVGPSGLVSKFKGPGCMATYLSTHPLAGEAVFVTDFTSGKMIPPERARFVEVLTNPDTGENDLRAYLDGREADAAALEERSAATDWKGVLDFGRTQ